MASLVEPQAEQDDWVQCRAGNAVACYFFFPVTFGVDLLFCLVLGLLPKASFEGQV